MARFVLVTQNYLSPEFDSIDEALKLAKQRIQKNQRCFSGERIHFRYMICQVKYYIGPREPIVDIEVTEAPD